MKKTKEQKILLKIYSLLCKEFGPQEWWPANTKFEVIVGAILTQNTAWGNVEKAISNLKRKRVLSIKGLSSISKNNLAKLIRPSGYYNIKARRLKNFLVFLNKQNKGSIKKMFASETQKLRKGLLKIKGIGPETADSILLYAANKAIFVVDAYTKRVFSRHGLIARDADYQAVQYFFNKNLPRSARLFNEFHALIVKLGKDFCKKEPLCDNCPIRRLRHGRRSKRCKTKGSNWKTC